MSFFSPDGKSVGFHSDNQLKTIRLDATAAPVIRPARGCYWVVTARFADTMHNGCRSCTDYYFRREDRRRSRHEARRELRGYHGDD